MTTPQIHFDDDKPPLSDGWIGAALIAGALALMVVALLVGLTGCMGDGGEGGVVKQYSLISMGSRGSSTAIGDTADLLRMLLWIAGGLLVLALFVPRWRRVLWSALSAIWKLPMALVQRDGPAAKEAAADIGMAIPRAVGAAAEDPPRRAYERYRELGLTEGWIDPATGEVRRPVGAEPPRWEAEAVKRADTLYGSFWRNKDGSMTYLPPLVPLDRPATWSREEWALIQEITSEEESEA